jgi:hypothetical protein
METASAEALAESTTNGHERRQSRQEDSREDVHVISKSGDLILVIEDQQSTEQFKFRVDTKHLTQFSGYFSRLLGGHFGEAADISSKLKSLRLTYKSSEEIPSDELPQVNLRDIGNTSKLKSIRGITEDFLLSLHGLDTSTSSPPLVNLANLAIVADRFDALPFFAERTRRRKYFQAIDAKTKPKKSLQVPEDRVRQKLMLGVMLDYPPWVVSHSKHLIITDSVQWQPRADESLDGPLWWDIPSGIEDEMIFRRECVLETINSLQSHFLRLYTIGERQCKLGYGNSAQCDSFQLGEMTRFLVRIGTLRLQGNVFDATEAPSAYAGDIEKLLDALRQGPHYQIDENHRHCGIRARLVPLLEMLDGYLRLDSRNGELGICGDCWREHRLEYRWSGAKRPVIWSIENQKQLREVPQLQGKNPCLARHLAIRDLFLAAEREWTPRPVEANNGFSSTPNMKNFRF